MSKTAKDRPRVATVKYFYLVLTSAVLAMDQVAKYLVSRSLGGGGETVLIPGFMRLSYTENPGIAFGILSDGDVRWALVAVSVVAIIVVLFYMMKADPSNRLLLFSLSLLAAGISGNLVDRIRLGRVIDFIDIHYKAYHWPVFNVADSAITVGAALMAFELFLTQPEQATAGEEPESALLKGRAQPGNVERDSGS